MNLIDKIVGAFSPQALLEREVARKRLEGLEAFGYSRHGASYARKSLQRWVTSPNDADHDIVMNIETLRGRSRDLFMGSPLATGAIKTIRTNVVGSGLSLNAQIDSDFLGLTDEQARAWEKDVEREWALWANTVECDAERRQNFSQLQALVLLSAVMSGDVFVTLPYIKRKGSVYDIRVALIEADRVRDPALSVAKGKNILGGVEVDTYGAPIAYWVAKGNKSVKDVLGEDDSKRVLAFGAESGRRNVLHIMCDAERPAQRRGVPFLAPVIEELLQIRRYTEAELMAAVVSGMFTVFVKAPTSEGFSEPFDPEEGEAVNDTDLQLGNGAVVNLAEGEEIQTANPNRPNPNFDGFVLSLSRQIGSALEIPYELLLKNFTNSYSASRGALLEAWKMFRMRREWITSAFCQPVYEAWLEEAVLKGRVNAPGFFDDPAVHAAWCGAEWFGDSQGQLDPLKEAKAAKVRVDEGFSTREREAMELSGMKYDAIHVIREREERMRREAGLTAPIVSDEEEKENAED